MTVNLLDPSVGIDRFTGSIVTGFAHVEQSIEDLFSTSFSERILREWYGSLIPKLLGRNLTSQEVLPFFAAISSAIDVWEPRFRVTNIDVLEVNRLGELHVILNGEYRPRATYGDFTVEGIRQIGTRTTGGGINIIQIAAIGNG